MSVKAYLNSRRANSTDEDSDAVLGSDDDIPIVGGGLSSTKASEQRKTSHEGYEQHRSRESNVGKAPPIKNREYSL